MAAGALHYELSRRVDAYSECVEELNRSVHLHESDGLDPQRDLSAFVSAMAQRICSSIGETISQQLLPVGHSFESAAQRLDSSLSRLQEQQATTQESLARLITGSTQFSDLASRLLSHEQRFEGTVASLGGTITRFGDATEGAARELASIHERLSVNDDLHCRLIAIIDDLLRKEHATADSLRAAARSVEEAVSDRIEKEVARRVKEAMKSGKNGRNHLSQALRRVWFNSGKGKADDAKKFGANG
jgi:hypothetical protein